MNTPTTDTKDRVLMDTLTGTVSIHSAEDASHLERQSLKTDVSPFLSNIDVYKSHPTDLCHKLRCTVDGEPMTGRTLTLEQERYWQGANLHGLQDLAKVYLAAQIHNEKLHSLVLAPKQAEEPTLSHDEPVSFTDFLKRKFPDGLVIDAPSISLDILKQYEWSKITEEYDKLDQSVLWGMSGQGQHPLDKSGTGELEAELHLTPDQYHLLRPDDSYAYLYPDLANEGWQQAAATAFMRTHADDNSHMSFEMDVTAESLRCLRIEGQPFNRVMTTVYDTRPRTDIELKRILVMQNLVEKGYSDKPLPDSIRPLVEECLPKGEKVVDNPDFPTYQSYLMAMERQLNWFNALELGAAVNYCAVYDPSDGGRAAREVVDTVNRLASQVPGEPFAMATRQGNHVTVSCHHAAASHMREVERTVRTHPSLIAFTKQPYNNQQELEYLILDTGQVIAGYTNVEYLHSGYEYTLKSRGVEGDISKVKLVNEPGKAALYNLFTSREAVEFPESYDDQITVHRRLTQQQNIDAANIINLRFDEGRNHDGGVTIQGETSRYRLAELTLNPEDTRIYRILRQQAGKHPDNNHQMNIFKRAVASEYYATAIAEERDRIKAINAGHAAERAQKQAILDRIDGVELYGKVNDLHIRAVIDGKFQPGRQLVEHNSWKSLMKAVAKAPGPMQGKEYQYYPAYMMEETRKQIAANIYRDVLGTLNPAITNAKARYGQDGNLYLSCHINGEYQLPRKVSEKDIDGYGIQAGIQPEQWMVAQLADKYFNAAAKLAEVREQSSSMHR